MTPIKREQVPMMKTIAAVLVSALASPSSVLAQAATVGSGQSAIVQDVASSASSIGLRQSIEREGARLAKDNLGAAALQPQPSPQRSWAGRHPVALGAMIGAAGGTVWTVYACQGACEGHAFYPPVLALGVGLGTGIGAGIGAIISLVRR